MIFKIVWITFKTGGIISYICCPFWLKKIQSDHSMFKQIALSVFLTVILYSLQAQNPVAPILEGELGKPKDTRLKLDPCTESNAGTIQAFEPQGDFQSNDVMRDTIDGFKSKYPTGVIVLANMNEDKAQVMVGVGKDQSSVTPAGKVIKSILEPLGGRGGGRPDFAQGGCKTSFDAIKNVIDKIITGQIKIN